MRLYLLAMEDEAKDIINDFNLIKDVPFKLYQKEDTLLAITGVGKVNASFVFTSVLSYYDNINEVINIGFAGAHGNFKISDFVLVDEAIYHDFDLTMFNYKKGQVPNIKDDFLTNHNYLTLFYDLKRTKLYTGDQFSTEILGDNYLADMEGTALFQVAYLLNIDILSIKVVSDIIGSTDHILEYSDFETKGSKYLKELFDLIEVRLNEKRLNFT